MNKTEIWTKSPITGKDMVMQEFDDKNGVSKIDLSSGFFTNEFPLNYKKHSDFDIKKYEKGMPEIIKDNRFDDGESYWYPSTIQTEECLVFPSGLLQGIKKNEDGTEEVLEERLKWCWAPVKALKESEKVGDFESKADMEEAEYFINYLDACKKVKGFGLGDI
tara:strand:+ start:2677 stop:3165 length:489 start_codon:yes stop_codon:yes gene_type:complete